MPNFSVMLIAKNEAKTLPRLLTSLSEFQQRGGEVILVDTGSIDETPEIARGSGCEVHEVGETFVEIIPPVRASLLNERFVVGDEKRIVAPGDTLFNFAAARNNAALLASNNMIIVIDCDEVFTAFNIDSIENGIAEGAERFEYTYVHSHDADGADAIKFNRSSFYDRRKFQWTGIIHEILTGEGKVKFLPESDVKIEHWQEPKSGRSNYLAGLALDCYLNPTNDRNSHYFARELLWNDRPQSAIQEFERHIRMNCWIQERAQSMIYIGDAYIALNQVEEGLQWYHKAFLTDSSRREALLRLASHYWHLLDAPRTAAYASAALTIPLSHTYMDRMEDYTYLPHEMLYWAFWWIGDKQQSEEHWRKALAYRPQHEKYIKDEIFYRYLPKQVA